MPALSVLVPVRDARPWLAASFASLARQSFRDFEIVAVDDGSVDGSAEWLDAHARSERRLRVLHLPAVGLPTALAHGFAATHAPLIARHDADDVSHRRRFERQLEVLASDRTIGALGTRVRLVPAARVTASMRRWVTWNGSLLDHDAMWNEALVDSVLIHGTLLARREVLRAAGGWIERGWPEDADLWLRMFASGARIAKLPQVLYGWRQHTRNATRHDPRYRRHAFDAFRLAGILQWLGTWRGAGTLVGVGAGLERWRCALSKLHNMSWSYQESARPNSEVLARLAPPLVLVFGAPPARARWRTALTGRQWSERNDFIFVA